MRVSQGDEMKGLDITSHGEKGYNVLKEELDLKFEV